MEDQPNKFPVSAVAGRIVGGKGPFSNARIAWVERLVSSGKLVRATIGQVLIAPAKLPDHLFIVVDGRVRLLGVGAKGSPPGLGSYLSGLPVDAATAAVDSMCLMVERTRFSELLAEEAELEREIHGMAVSTELFNLLSIDFTRCALDISKVPDLVQDSALSARVISGGAEKGHEDYTWWIAEGDARGLRWSPPDGSLRRIGFPTAILERSEVPVGPQEPGTPAPNELPHAETLLDPLVDYPVITTQSGPIEEVISCYGMVSSFFGREFQMRCPEIASRHLMPVEI
jgi:hypothetical protein